MTGNKNERARREDEQCNRCEEPKDDLIDSGRGEQVCPACIMAEADAHRDKQRLHRERIEVKRERGMWVEK